MEKVLLYGIPFEKSAPRDTVKKLCGYAGTHGTSTVYTPNLQMLCRASGSKKLASLLKSADMLIPDGVGITLLCRKCGQPPIKRIAGIDAAYAVMKYAARHGLSVFLLGGTEGTAELAGARLSKEMEGLDVCGTRHGYFDKKRHSEENRAVLAQIKKSRADIVFVCFGFPAQEAWIYENAPSLPDVRLFMGLGGSLDVWSGKARRAPVAFRALGLEWLWRCAREPKRFVKLFKDTLSGR